MIEDLFSDESVRMYIPYKKGVEVDLSTLDPHLKNLIVIVKGLDAYQQVEKNILEISRIQNMLRDSAFLKQYEKTKKGHFLKFYEKLTEIPEDKFLGIVKKSIFADSVLPSTSIDYLLQYFLTLEEYEKCSETFKYLNLLKKA